MYGRWKIVKRPSKRLGRHFQRSTWYHVSRGLCEIADGLVILFTLGYFYPGISLDHTFAAMKKYYERQKKNQESS